MRSGILLMGLFAALASAAVGQDLMTNISGLGAMAGCWERNDKVKSVFFSEHWMKPAGTSMLGMGRTVKNGKTVDYEFMRIEQRADGIYFIAQPKANSGETAFKLIRSTAGEVVFENKEHDFPQRIIYRFGGTTLTGRIEGDNKGKFAAVDFPFERANCNP